MAKRPGMRDSRGNVPQVKDRTARITALVSLGVGTISLILSVLTYSVTHRPYLGLAETAQSFDNSASPQRLEFRFHFQNSGTMPAIVIEQDIQPQLVKGDQIVDLPRPAPTGRNVTVLPGQRVEIPGVLGQPHLAEVLSKQAAFQVVVALKYGTTGALSWWQQYRYRTTQRFNPGAGVRWFNIDTQSE